MNETEQYICESIKVWVWSGFYNLDEIMHMADDILEEDTDVDVLMQYARNELAQKKLPNNPGYR